MPVSVETAIAEPPVARVLLSLLGLLACDPGAFDDVREQRDQPRDAAIAPVQAGTNGLDAGPRGAMDGGPVALRDGASPDALPAPDAAPPVCTLRCDSPERGIAACEANSCVGYTPRVGTPSPQNNVLHGSASSGGPFDLVCGVDEVLTGFDTAFDMDIVYELSALCAPLRVAGALDHPQLSLGSSHASPMVGALNLAWTPPHVSFPCPAGLSVSALDGSVWYKNDAARTNGELSIKQLIMTCSVLAVDGNGKFSRSGDVQVSVGNNVGTVEKRFSDRCNAGSTVVGIKGRAGAWIDALQTECGVLRVDRAATSSHVSSAAEADALRAAETTAP